MVNVYNHLVNGKVYLWFVRDGRGIVVLVIDCDRLEARLERIHADECLRNRCGREIVSVDVV